MAACCYGAQCCNKFVPKHVVWFINDVYSFEVATKMNEFLRYLDKYNTMKNIEFNMELETHKHNL